MCLLWRRLCKYCYMWNLWKGDLDLQWYLTTYYNLYLDTDTSFLPPRQRGLRFVFLIIIFLEPYWTLCQLYFAPWAMRLQAQVYPVQSCYGALRFPAMSRNTVNTPLIKIWFTGTLKAAGCQGMFFNEGKEYLNTSTTWQPFLLFISYYTLQRENILEATF